MNKYTHDINKFISLSSNSERLKELKQMVQDNEDPEDFSIYFEYAFDEFLFNDLRWKQLDRYVEESMDEIDRRINSLELDSKYAASSDEKKKDIVFEELLEMKPFYYQNNEFDEKLLIFDDIYLLFRQNPEMVLDHLIELRNKLSFKQISLLTLKIENNDFVFRIEIDPSITDGPVEHMVKKRILIQGDNIPVEYKKIISDEDLESYFMINTEHSLFKDKDLSKLVQCFNFVLLYIEVLGKAIIRDLEILRS